MFCPMSAIADKKHNKDLSGPLCCFEALHFDICSLSTQVQMLVYVVILLCSLNVLQEKHDEPVLQNWSWDRDSGWCCVGHRKIQSL